MYNVKVKKKNGKEFNFTKKELIDVNMRLIQIGCPQCINGYAQELYIEGCVRFGAWSGDSIHITTRGE